MIPNQGAAKFEVAAFLLMFYCIRCFQIIIFNQLGVPLYFFQMPKGCREPKKVEKHCTGEKARHWNVLVVFLIATVITFTLLSYSTRKKKTTATGKQKLNALFCICLSLCQNIASCSNNKIDVIFGKYIFCWKCCKFPVTASYLGKNNIEIIVYLNK